MERQSPGAILLVLIGLMAAAFSLIYLSSEQRKDSRSLELIDCKIKFPLSYGK
jgi:hypothetical protein